MVEGMFDIAVIQKMREGIFGIKTKLDNAG